jgi:hypothetical protein
MKKLLALSIALALLGTSAFAEIKVGFGAWIFFVPYSTEKAKDSDATNTGYITKGWSPWTKSIPRLQVRVTGNNAAKTVGFDVQLRTEETTEALQPSVLKTESFVGFGDYATIWAQPTDGVKVNLGRYQIDTFRGKIGTDNDLGNWIGNPGSPDAIFNRVQHNTNFGNVAATFVPVSGLTIITHLKGIPDSLSLWTDDGSDATPDDGLKNGFKNFQLVVGYNLVDIGLARAQLIDQRIEAAFAFTALDAIVIDAGIKIPITDAVKASVTAPVYGTWVADGWFQASVGATLSGPLSVTTLLTFVSASKFNGSDDGASAVDIYAQPELNLGALAVGGGVNLGFAFGDPVKDTAGVNLGLGAYVKKPFTGGYVSAGLDFKTNTEDNLEGKAGLSRRFGLPISLYFAI